MRLPKYEPQQIPPGKYQFEIHEMPEARIGKNDVTYLIFKFQIFLKDDQTQILSNLIWPSEPRYLALLRVLDAKKDQDGTPRLDTDVLGKRFRADLIHSQDKKDPTKKWTKLTNFEPVDVFQTSEEKQEESGSGDDFFWDYDEIIEAYFIAMSKWIKLRKEELWS